MNNSNNGEDGHPFGAEKIRGEETSFQAAYPRYGVQRARCNEGFRRYSRYPIGFLPNCCQREGDLARATVIVVFAFVLCMVVAWGPSIQGSRRGWAPVALWMIQSLRLLR